jgi:hypothetical protein
VRRSIALVPQIIEIFLHPISQCFCHIQPSAVSYQHLFC